MKMGSQTKLIRCAARDVVAWQALASRLEQILPVSFSFENDAAAAVVGGISSLGAELESHPITGLQIAESGPEGRPSQAKVFCEVQFTDDLRVPFPFRGRKLSASVGQAPVVLRPSASETVLATTADGPVWTIASKSNGVSIIRSGFAIPHLSEHENFGDVFGAEQFFELLPVLHWLNLLGLASWGKEKFRACYIFDDPNLHWPTYGYVDYREIVRRAVKHHYHVSFAAIPLDMWFSHQRTVDLFKKNAGQISLCVHGNNHLKKELSGNYSVGERHALLGQSWLRKERFEKRTGLDVSPIMVPPHGACSEVMLRDLPRFGFRGASISHGSLRAHNPKAQWVQTLGLRACEEICGVPVMPRWAFGSRDRNAVLIAAYLGQALILRGHHQDLKGGVELLDERADFINKLGEVAWSDLSTLNLKNYEFAQCELGSWQVRPLSNHVVVDLPGQDARQFGVAHSDPAAKWIVSSHGLVTKTISTGEQLQLPEKFSGKIEVLKAESDNPAAIQVNVWPRPWPFLRRILTETRDRLA